MPMFVAAPAQKMLDHFHLAPCQRLADRGSADAAVAVVEWCREHFGLEPHRLTDLRDARRCPFAIAAERVVRPHQHEPHVERLVQEAEEIGRRQFGDLRRERERGHRVQAGSLEQFDALLEAGDVRDADLGSEHLDGRGVQRDHRARQPTFCRPLLQRVDQEAVAKVHAVENADRDGGRPSGRVAPEIFLRKQHASGYRVR
jgi:hypothetical protein